MGLQIDRACNIIINAGGVAHRTGWVAPNFHSIDPQAPKVIMRGRGHCAGSVYRFETHGEVVAYGGKGLTAALFIELTGWAPDASA